MFTQQSLPTIKIEEELATAFKPYKKKNAYSQKLAWQQIMTALLFIGHFTMHCIFVIRPIVGIDHPLMYFLWGVHFLALFAVLWDYFVLTCGDPVDRIIIEPNKIDEIRRKFLEFGERHAQNKAKSNPYEVKFCQNCLRTVMGTSYHCWTCGRCVERLDHHCKYLNNCIGAINYFNFFRLLSCSMLYFACSGTISLWIFIRSFDDGRIEDLSFNKWAVFVYLMFGVIFSIFVMALAWFHCYISCYKRMTTLEYLFRDSESNGVSSDSSQTETETKLG